MCAVKDCDRPRLARGWCNTHYRRWQKHGDPLKVSKPGPRRRPHCGNGHSFDKGNTYQRRNGKRACIACARFYSRRRVRRLAEQGIRPPQAKERKAQWQKDVRAGVRVPKRRKRRPVHSQVSDLLLIEGGWWTVEAVALRLRCTSDAAGQSLYRLEKSGVLEARRVGLATGKNRQGLDSRKEWKAITQMVLAFDD